MKWRTLGLLVTSVMLVACSKITQDNFSQLETGMPRAEVEKLLGKPVECSGALGITSCTWGDQVSVISVQYAADKVLMFSGRGLK